MTLAALVAGLALLAAAVPAAEAAPAATSNPTNTCWLDVVNDWLDHNGQIHQQYPIACYTQAIQHLNQYPDVQNYSNAEDDIHRALLAVLRQDRGGGPGAGSVVTVPPSPDKGGGSSSKGVVTRVADSLNPGSAQSVPLPLIVLGILALLLMLTALGTWIAKRMQSRRPTPATAPATSRSRRR